MRHRPIGIGVQGLADACHPQAALCRSIREPAKVLNREIFETIYYAALDRLQQGPGEGERRVRDSYEGSPREPRASCSLICGA